jgi:protein-L-isoaspartate(D-aspartate) O-methyltransferase
MDLDLRRRFYAEELEAVCRLRSAALVDALAAVPREHFLPPGPWTVLVDVVSGGGSGVQTRVTADADPARVYHNIGVAIDPSRQLAHIVGPGGRVVAFEADDILANRARANLLPYPQIDARCGDASGQLDGPFDAVLVNAGLTHPLEGWLDAVTPSGKLVLPLTSTMAAMGSNIGKGIVLLLTKQDSGDFAVRSIGFAAIYSAIGVRDAGLNDQLGKAMMSGPARWQGITRLRRDAHELSASCWLHAATFCLTA